MHRAETRISTPNASKYLQQLCKHWSHKFEVSFTPQSGRVPFGADRACVMEADAEFLTLRVETQDAESSARLGAIVVEHLHRFAHREELAEARWRAI
jgi:uncharacterized protein